MENVFLRILNMGITAGYCVLVILLIRLFLKRLPKIYSYVLWSVVYFRLLCPVSVKSVFSLVRVSPQTIPSDITTQITPHITSGVSQVDAVVNTGLAQAVPAAVEASANPLQIIVYVASMLWLIGVLALFAYNAWVLLRLKRQLRDACRVEEKVYEADNLHTPFVFGFFVPRIYLPAELGQQEREYVLAHEKTHIKRRDYLIRQAAFLITCVYWFHPLIWVAFYLMCRDMEMSCDESVIRRMGGGRKEYSAALLSLASGRQILNGGPLAFGEGGIKGRITNIIHYKRPAFWAGAAITVLLAAVLIGLAVNPKEGDAQDESYKQEEQPVALTDFLMGQAEMTLGNGTVTVELWMTEGVYFDIDYAVPGLGIYEENYQGSYELRTTDDAGNVLDREMLGEELSFSGDETSCNFPGKMDIAWTDYNLDGCPDFSIGMAGSSSTNLYRLYTVCEDGTLGVLCESLIPGETGQALSVVFEHDASSEGMPLLGYFWNNATGSGEHWYYYYNQETGLYEEGDTVITEGEADEATR